MKERTVGQMAADKAHERLSTRGFTSFRNGKIVSPKGYVATDEDRADFDIVKAAFPHSVLI